MRASAQLDLSKIFRRVLNEIDFRIKTARLERRPDFSTDRTALLPALHGDLPAADGAPFLFVPCDGIYLDCFAAALISSVAKNSPGIDVHVHLYDPSAENFRTLQRLRAKLINATLTVTWEKVIDDYPDTDARRVYYQTIRFVRARTIIETCRRSMLCLDADSLVLAPLDPYWEYFALADIRMQKRLSHWAIGVRLLASTLFLGWTPMTREYLREYSCLACAHLCDAGHWRGMADQRFLYQAYRRMKRAGAKPHIGDLDAAFVDAGLAKTAVIWCLRGERKADPRYAHMGETLKEQILP